MNSIHVARVHLRVVRIDHKNFRPIDPNTAPPMCIPVGPMDKYGPHKLPDPMPLEEAMIHYMKFNIGAIALRVISDFDYWAVLVPESSIANFDKHTGQVLRTDLFCVDENKIATPMQATTVSEATPPAKAKYAPDFSNN